MFHQQLRAKWRRVTICNFLIDIGENMFIFALDSDDKTLKVFVSLNYEMLYFIYNSKIEYFSEKVKSYLNDLNNFLQNLTKNEELYLKLKNLLIFIEKCSDLIKFVHEKIKHYRIRPFPEFWYNLKFVHYIIGY